MLISNEVSETNLRCGSYRTRERLEAAFHLLLLNKRTWDEVIICSPGLELSFSNLESEASVDVIKHSFTLSVFEGTAVFRIDDFGISLSIQISCFFCIE